MLSDYPAETMTTLVEGDCFTFTLPQGNEKSGRVITDIHALRRVSEPYDPPMRISRLHDGELASHENESLADFLALAPGANPFSTAGREIATERLKAATIPPGESERALNARMETEFDESFRQLPGFIKLMAHAYVPYVMLCKTSDVEHLHGRENDILGVSFYGGHHRSPEVVAEEIMHYVDAHILFYKNMDDKRSREVDELDEQRNRKIDFVGEANIADHFSLQPTFIAAVDADIAGARSNPAAASLIRDSQAALHKGNFFTRLPQGRDDRYFEALVDFMNMYLLLDKKMAAQHDADLPLAQTIDPETVLRQAFPHISRCFFKPEAKGEVVGRDAQGRPVIKQGRECPPTERFAPFLQMAGYRIWNNQDIAVPGKHRNGDDTVDDFMQLNNRRFLPGPEEEYPRPQRSRRGESFGR